MNTPKKVLISRDWISSSEVRPEDQALPVRQVYAWLFSRDDKIAIVSKDGQKWQFPGGKPDDTETYLQTAVREVAEETGIDTSDLTDDYQFFGYYHIVETNERGNDDEYLQLRVSLQLDKNADEYALHQDGEDGAQAWEEQVHFAKFVTIDELMEHIPWTRESAELRAAIQGRSHAVS